MRVWLLLLLLPLNLVAQVPKLKTGIEAFKNEDYQTAISLLDGVIAAKAKKQEQADAHYYRAESYVKLYQWAVQNRHEPFLHQYADAYASAVADFSRAAELDRDAWQTHVQRALQELYPDALRDGLLKLEQAKKESDSGERTALLQAAARVLHAVAKVQPQQYLPVDLLGQIAMQQAQYRQAEAYFRQSATLFAQYPPANPDLLAAYTYYRLALLYRHYLNGQTNAPEPAHTQTSLEFLRQAKGVLEAEYRRAARMAGKLSSKELERYQRQYNTIAQDFYYLELDLYLQLPHLHDEALVKLQDALRKDPNNYTLLIVYAQLQEGKDMALALQTYMKAVQLNPENYEANYHIGTIYVNEAARLEQEARRTADIDHYQHLNAQSREYMIKARPYLQAAYRSRPDSLEVVQALMQISLQLHAPHDYQQYKRRKMELGGG